MTYKNKIYEVTGYKAAKLTINIDQEIELIRIKSYFNNNII